MRIKQYLNSDNQQPGGGHNPSRQAGLRPLPLLGAAAAFVLAHIGARPAVSETAPNPAWAAFYNGPGNFYDYGRAVAVDTAGNVYVTGASDNDYVTAKYDSAGNRLWASRFDGEAHGIDTPVAVVVDSTGNVYVTGTSYGGNPNLSGTDYDFATVKYDSAGGQLWVRRYNGPSNREDNATALAVDADGNVFVGGSTFANATGADYTVVKYSAAGSELWARRYDGTGGADNAGGLAVGADGSVVITGESWGGVSLMDITSVKYTSGGVEDWVARYDHNLGMDSGVAVQVSGTGDVFVTGVADGGPNGGGGTEQDYATLKYTAEGGQSWVKTYDSGARRIDAAAALALDADGNVYVTGRSHTAAGGLGYLTAAYGPTGTQLWTARYDASGAADDMATAIGVSPDGNVFVTGQSTAGNGLAGYATLKYSSAGAALWTARYNGPTAGPSGAVALALQGADALLITGSTWGTSGTLDFGTVKYRIGAANAPTAPSQLVAALTSNLQVKLAWKDNSNGETGFRIERKVGTGAYAQIGLAGANATTFTDSTVSPRGKYRYRVRATNGVGDSANSNEVSVTVPTKAAGRLGVSPMRITFPKVRIGSTATKTVTLRNLGNAILTGTVTAPAAPFSATGGAFTLWPRETRKVEVRFAPTAEGSATGELRVQSLDPAKPPVIVKLSGKGF